MGNNEGVEEGQRGAVRLRKAERLQLSFLPHCIDDLVSPDHRVRMVMAVMERLDLSDFCTPIRAREGRAGRDATDPRLLVGLWLYGCVRGIGSARELARRCEESLPFRWLCGGVSVNDRLLSDFRGDHGDALDALFTQVLVSLVDKKLVRVSRISQDGVRVRVSAGSNSFRRQERLELLLAQVRQHVSELREQLASPAQSGAMTEEGCPQTSGRIAPAAVGAGDCATAGAEAESRLRRPRGRETVRSGIRFVPSNHG